MEASALRHHRTALLVGALARLSPENASEVLASLHVGVSIGPFEARTRSGQAALLTAVNALARSSGSLSLRVPVTPIVLPNLPWTGSLDAAAHAIAEWAGGRVVGGNARHGVSVGPSTSGYVVAAGDEWTARIDDDAHLGDAPLTLGAVAAAHLASARAFHIALAEKLEIAPVTRAPAALRLWRVDVAPPVPAPSAAEITLVGAGAVAQALLWSLALSGARIVGELALFDPQRMDATNLNRHLLAGTSDVGRAKAELAAAFIRPFAPGVRPRVERFVSPGRVVNRIVSTVDNDEARYQIQGAFPHHVFHAATSGEGVAAAVLDFADGACLGCLFPRPQRSEAQRIADETGLRLERVTRVLAENGAVTEDMLAPIAARLGLGIDVLGRFLGRSLREVYARELCGRLATTGATGMPAPTIAYASGLAGALIAAELVKAGDARLEHGLLRNYVQLSANAPGSEWVVRREKQDDCPLMCGDPVLQEVVRTLRTEMRIEAQEPHD